MSVFQKILKNKKFKEVFSNIEKGVYFNSDLENEILSENNKKMLF